MQHRIILPGATTLTRLISEVREKATLRLWNKLALIPSAEQRSQLEMLLGPTDCSRLSLLESLKKGPVTISGPAFNEAIERWKTLNDFGLHAENLSTLPAVRLKNLARYAGMTSVFNIARMSPQKRMAVLVAFVLAWETLALDDALDVLDAMLAVIIRDARKIGQKKRLRSLKDLEDKQFKNAKSNFKIAIVVDMWLTGFDVPELDTIYIDKPLQKHNLIQTISRVNRKLEGKSKGLVVDYIGIKSQMNQALAMYSRIDATNFEDIQQSVIEVKNHLDLLGQVFYEFDSRDYFSGEPQAQLSCLNRAAEFVLRTQKVERRFMGLVKRMKAAYDVCCGSEALSQTERDYIHYYLAVRSIVFKLTKGDAPDVTQMNARVREMIAEALKADGVEEIYFLGDKKAESIDIFDEDYLARINKIKLPATKIQLLQKLLEKAISDFKKVNQLQGINFTRRFQAIIDRYNERREDDVLNGEEFDTFSQEMTDIIYDIKTEMGTWADLGIDIEEKAFFDILAHMRDKYQFTYDDEKMLSLAKEMKSVVDNTSKYPDWSKRDDIKAKLKVELILLLHKHKFPPVANDDVYMGVLAQAENFKEHHMSSLN